jgi:hypothetical protein
MVALNVRFQIQDVTFMGYNAGEFNMGP